MLDKEKIREYMEGDARAVLKPRKGGRPRMVFGNKSYPYTGMLIGYKDGKEIFQTPVNSEFLVRDIKVILHDLAQVAMPANPPSALRKEAYEWWHRYCAKELGRDS